MTETTTSALRAWNDPRLDAETRVEALVAAMTPAEKVAQLYGVWVGASAEGQDVAPHQHDMDNAVDLEALIPLGLGQLTRPFGTAPVDPALGAVSLARTQQRIVDASRFGIPAIAHEECLAGFAAWQATAYPVPLSWGATFNPELVERMARRIGEDMRSVGVHQGLAPVLDVVRDARWGRVEETIGEDPYLVGRIGSSYVRGLEDAGIVATLKHFVGYSASKAGRNLAPVSIGARERADVLLVPFEMALRDGGARSVMHSYTDIDGVPSAADATLLTELLRDTWGFTGTVVADYFGVAFLHTLHGVADGWQDAAIQALTAGVDVELPTVHTYSELVAAIASGEIDGALIDRALRRVLAQKLDLGLLDADWEARPAGIAGIDDASARGSIDLDTAENRAIAREIAEQAVILVRNDGTLPLGRPRRIAVVGPNGQEPLATLGCYSFPAHVGVHHPEVALGLQLPTIFDAVRAEFPDAEVTFTASISVDGPDTSGIEHAVRAARSADTVIVALGDRAGLFGRGTSGEGCDAEDLALPGAQQQLLDAILDTGTPTIVTLLSGRPYALGRATVEAGAIVQTFFPGEEGTPAIAGVLSGRLNPSGRLPVSIPATPGSQPSTYLAAPLGNATEVSNVDPTAAYAFGHGLGYSDFEWRELRVLTGNAATDGTFHLTLSVSNTGERAGVEVVQLYLHDPVASVVRPVRRLIGFTRVSLDAGETAEITVRVPADVASFTGRAGTRIVEPGLLRLEFGTSSEAILLSAPVTLTGPVRQVGFDRELHATLTRA